MLRQPNGHTGLDLFRAVFRGADAGGECGDLFPDDIRDVGVHALGHRIAELVVDQLHICDSFLKDDSPSILNKCAVDSRGLRMVRTASPRKKPLLKERLFHEKLILVMVGIVTLTKYYGVTSDYLLELSENKNPESADLSDLHFRDTVMEILSGGKLNDHPI